MSLSKSTEYFMSFMAVLYVFLLLCIIMFGYYNMKHYADCILEDAADIFMCFSEDVESLEDKNE
jgi:Na+/alanine symporter